MAIAVYKQSCQQRSRGQNAVAKAAYNSCSRLRLEDHDADYTKKTGLVYSALLFAEGEKKISRQDFWEKVEASETWKTATVSREGICPLPIELTRDQRLALALDFSKRMIDTYNFSAIDINIHEPVKRKRNATAKENPHAHLQFPDRDRHGKKIRALSKRSELKKIRAMWGETVNEHLARAGLAIRIDMRSVEAQLEEAEAAKAKVDQELADLEKEITAIEADLKSLEEKKDGIEESEKSERDHRGSPAQATAGGQIPKSPGLSSQGAGGGAGELRKDPGGDTRIREKDDALLQVDRRENRGSVGSRGAGSQPCRDPDRRRNSSIKRESSPAGGDHRDHQKANETETAEFFAEMMARVKGMFERHKTAADLLYLRKTLEQANARDKRPNYTPPNSQTQVTPPHP